MSLPDARIKQTKKLVALIHGWKDTERQWVQAEMALDNLEEQLRAVTGSCKEFDEICIQALGQEKGLGVKWKLGDKIKVAIKKTRMLQETILAELESQQKKFYGHRLETEKSLQELTSMPANLIKGQAPYFRWDEVVRWTVELHTALCASIEAKKSKLPFDPPNQSAPHSKILTLCIVIVENVLERLDSLNYM